MINNLLFQSIALHISGLITLTLILFLYIRGKKDSSFTSRAYIDLIILTYVVNFTQMGAFTFKYLEEIKGMQNMALYAEICARAFILSSVIWGAVFECYFCTKFLIDQNDKKKLKKLTMVAYSVATLLFIVSFFFDIKYHTDSERYVLNGPFSITTYTAFGLGVIVIIVSLFKNREDLSFLKVLTLLFVISSYVFLAVLEKITNYDISEVPYILSLYTITMYFTLENIDYVKISKMKEEEKEAEDLQIKSSSYVENFSKNIIVSLNNAFLIANVLNNKELSDEETLDNIHKLEGETKNMIEYINSIGDVEE